MKLHKHIEQIKNIINESLDKLGDELGNGNTDRLEWTGINIHEDCREKLRKGIRNLYSHMHGLE